MVSAAALMGVSPVVGSAVNINVAFAATKKSKSVKVYNTMGKHSRIKPTKTMYFVNNNGKKTSKKAYKNSGNYIIYNVKEVNGVTYFSIQSDLKYWIPATATRGSVQYQDGNKLVTITTDGKKVVQTEKTLKSSSKKSTKASTKSTKKTTKTDSKKSTKSEKTSTKSESKKSDEASTKKSSKSDEKSTSSKKTTDSDSKKSSKNDSAKSDSKSDEKTTKDSAKSDSKKSTKSDSKVADEKSEKKSTKSDSKKSDEKSTSSKKSTKKTIKVTNIVAKRKAQVYDKNGKKAKTYMGSKKWTIIGKGVQVKGLGTKTIDGVKYYALQPNHYYVKASDFTIKK